MSNFLLPIEHEIMTWPGITSAPHQFSAIEFNLNLGQRTAEVGHIHSGRLLDILYSVAVREILVREGKANPHHIVPETGWITYPIRSQADVAGALWLLRLSYLQKVASARKPPANIDVSAELDALGVDESPRWKVLRAKILREKFTPEEIDG